MRTVAVIGAGQMGSGITQTVAQFGMKVLLSDVDIALAEKAKANIEKAYTRLVSREKMTPDDAIAALARITPVADYAPMADADLITLVDTSRRPYRAVDHADPVPARHPGRALGRHPERGAGVLPG